MTEPELTLDDRYLRFSLAVLTALAAVGLAILYSHGARAAAEVEWLEQIPVLDVDP